jgi:Chlamydia polymorphic membrane protein (Chlamydia_PMP) repeat
MKEFSIFSVREKERKMFFTKKAGLFLFAGLVIIFMVSCNEEISNPNYVPPPKPVYCVDPDATGANSGGCWEDAFTDLQTAVNTATEGYEVWVKGDHSPDPFVYTSLAGGTSSVLIMKEGVHIYGGFVGNEQKLENRDWEINKTILDGKYASCNVVKGASHATLDGFVIKRGYNSGDLCLITTVKCGAGMNNSNVSGITIRNCEFITNDSTDHGGAIYNYQMDGEIDNCLFERNNSDRFGGAIYNYSSSPHITHSTFLNNSAQDGGAIHNTTTSAPRVFGSSFINNYATRNGGAFNNEQESYVIIENSLLEDNHASSFGGAIRNDENLGLEVIGCFFTRNGCGGGGGAIYNHNAPIQVSNTSFNFNETTIVGPTTSDYFRGGAVWLVGDTSSSFSNCLFWENTATYGGAVANTGSFATFTNCTFSGNVASVFGGGVFNEGSSNPTFNNSILYGNATALVINENVYNDGSSLVNNYSTIDDDPLFIEHPLFWTLAGGTNSRNHLTLADVSVFSEGDLIEIDNDGIKRTVLSIIGNDIRFSPLLDETIQPTLDFLLIENWGSDTDNIDEDFHLQEGSGCLNTGDFNLAPDTDIGGTQRPAGGGVDRGVYEQ